MMEMDVNFVDRAYEVVPKCTIPANLINPGNSNTVQSNMQKQHIGKQIFGCF